MTAAIQNTNPTTTLINSLNASNSSLSGGAAAKAAANGATGLQNEFMTLLTTQLQNQDPMNPMDSSQMTAQLASISTVSGINQLNTALQALSSTMSAGSATSMIGHGALVKGSSINLANGAGVFGVQLAQPADSLQVTIKDSSGATVRTLDLGAQQAGVLPFAWDGATNAGGTAPSGRYSFSVQAVASGSSLASTPLSYGMVNAVTPGVQGQPTTLDVGQIGTFDMSSILMVM
jgi:flagellar basal-body rod modification protein FlgD